MVRLCHVRTLAVCSEMVAWGPYHALNKDAVRSCVFVRISLSRGFLGIFPYLFFRATISLHELHALAYLQ
jgi:hypothetical protein